MKDHWAARSLGAGALATVIDVAALFFAHQLLHLAIALAAAFGVAVGGVASFLLNKYFAFRDRHGDLLRQGLKYALTLAAAMLVHGALMHLLVDRARLPVLPCKLGADLLIFSCGSLWAMRAMVFPRPGGPSPSSPTGPQPARVVADP